MLSESMKWRLRDMLQADIGSGDVTTALVPKKHCRATIKANEACVLAGLEEAAYLFEQKKVAVRFDVNEGGSVSRGRVVMELQGENHGILMVERTALNVLGRMSGVATRCAKAVGAAQNPRVQLMLTRKTMPGLNEFDKKACAFGGVAAHRKNLAERVLLKDNHLKFFGMPADAVKQAKKSGNRGPIEVEVRTVREALDVAAAGADIILLDNFSLADAEQAIKELRQDYPDMKIELSGSITLENVKAYARLNPDFISMGTLTKHAGMTDFSLDIEET